MCNPYEPKIDKLNQPVEKNCILIRLYFYFKTKVDFTPLKLAVWGFRGRCWGGYAIISDLQLLKSFCLPGQTLLLKYSFSSPLEYCLVLLPILWSPGPLLEVLILFHMRDWEMFSERSDILLFSPYIKGVHFFLPHCEWQQKSEEIWKYNNLVSWGLKWNLTWEFLRLTGNFC